SEEGGQSPGLDRHPCGFRHPDPARYRDGNDRGGAVAGGAAPVGRRAAGRGHGLGGAYDRRPALNGSGKGSAALIWCPFADEDSAARAADALLEEGLIACANILPGVRSIYRWQGERGEARECAVLFKTSAARLDEAVRRL